MPCRSIPASREAHYQLGETYLKLKDYNRAYVELSRAVDLAPDNYPAQVDLADLLISARQPERGAISSGFAAREAARQSRHSLVLGKFLRR